MCQLYKKGDPKKASTYRRICLIQSIVTCVCLAMLGRMGWPQKIGERVGLCAHIGRTVFGGGNDAELHE